MYDAKLLIPLIFVSKIKVLTLEYVYIGLDAVHIL